MRRRRGNVLLMAIFISVFLFFLSVALVAQNRQDALLSLTEDHRTRADAAARAGLALALHVMRTDADWQARLGDARSEMESGASWRVTEVRPLGDVLWRVQAEGTSGIARVTRAMVVERIGLGDLPVNARFFAFTDTGRLAMMDGTFKWRLLQQATDGQPQADFLAARNGPVFSHMPGERIQGQPLWDYGADGGMREVPLQILEGRTLTLLELDPVDRWTQLPRPDTPPTTGASPVPAANVYRSADALTQGTSYQGPSLDWYVLRGTGLAADGRKIYSHAVHYFYRGTKATVQPDSVTVEDPGRQFTGTAVLCYDLDTGRWTPVVDTMIVTDLRRDPQVTDPGSTRTPNQETLGLAGDRLYCLESGNDRSVLAGGARAWSFHTNSAGLSRGLYEYGGRLRLHDTMGTQDGLARVGLGSGLDPWEDLSLDRPAVKVQVWRTEQRQFEEQTAIPEQRIRGSLLGALAKTASFLEAGANDGSNCVTALGEDLYTFGRVRRVYPATPGASYFPPFLPEFMATSADVQNLVLLHYDGERWQLWPGGLHELSITAPANTGLALEAHSETGEVFRLDGARLALAVYPEQPDPPRNLDRFAPVVDLP